MTPCEALHYLDRTRERSLCRRPSLLVRRLVDVPRGQALSSCSRGGWIEVSILLRVIGHRAVALCPGQ